MQGMNISEYRNLNKELTRKSKYNARRVNIDGIQFHSAWEGERYTQLKILERTGHINQLNLQAHFPLEVNSVKIGTYIADFTYYENGKFVVEDAKGGAVTKDYAIKKKLMLAIHNIAILETRKPKKSLRNGN